MGANAGLVHPMSDLPVSHIVFPEYCEQAERERVGNNLEDLRDEEQFYLDIWLDLENVIQWVMQDLNYIYDSMFTWRHEIARAQFVIEDDSRSLALIYYCIEPRHRELFLRVLPELERKVLYKFSNDYQYEIRREGRPVIFDENGRYTD